MSTLTEYRTAVKLKGYDALSDATVDAAVQEGRRRVFMARRWSWLEASSTSLSTAANTDTVALSAITDLAHIDAVRLADAGTPIPMQFRDYSIVRDLQDRCGETGMPMFWTRRGSNLVFYPTPDRVYDITVEYAKAPGDLAVAPAEDVIPDKNQDLVVYAAVVPLAFRQRDFNASTAADQYFSRVLLSLHAGQDGVEQRQTSQQIRTGWWGGY